jgi:hypothetical protein
VLVFEPGQITQSFSVPILDDALDELTETTSVFLTTATNAVLAPPQTAQLSILDDDRPVVFLSSDVYEAFENSLASVSVWLSKPFSEEVRVNYSVAGGTASPGSDYIALNGTLSIFAGSTNAEVLVNLINDNVAEDDESVHVRLVSASGASLGPRTEADVHVLDDDRAPRLVDAGLAPTGHFRATAYGPPGQKFHVQSATSLGQWTPLLTLTNVAGRTTFTDPTAPVPSVNRFYRTTLP